MSVAKTPVSILQELLQKSNKIPQYVLLPSEGFGTHNPTFHYRVDADKVIGYGKARSKKDAKHEAAKDALAKYTDLGLYIPEKAATPPSQTSPVNQMPETPIFQINAVGMLKDFVAEHNLPPPEFTEISDVGPAHQRLFTLQCAVGTLKKTATEYTKKKAKQACAQLMYQCLLESLPDVMDSDDNIISCKDEGPSYDAIMQEFSSTSISNKKKDNYKLKICDYPQTFMNIMKEKNLTYDELWGDVDDTDLASEQQLEHVLQKFDLRFSLESFDNEENNIIILSIDSEPIFCMAKIADSIQEAVPHLLGEALKFLKIMTSH